jgi:hypothetical protein
MPVAAAALSPAQTALANANLAALQHSYEHVLAGDQETLSDDQAAFRANQGKLNATEPTAMTNVRNRANEEGLATSGIEGQRADQQQASFARSMGALTTTRQQEMDKINRGMGEENEAYKTGREKIAAEGEVEQEKEAQANAKENPTLGSTAANAAAPANPGGSRVVTGAPGPGGVVPYSESSRPGFVRVGPGTPKPPVTPVVAIRKAAAKKVAASR